MFYSPKSRRFMSLWRTWWVRNEPGSSKALPLTPKQWGNVGIGELERTSKTPHQLSHIDDET
jgi:hypothetical protein